MQEQGGRRSGARVTVKGRADGLPVNRSPSLECIRIGGLTSILLLLWLSGQVMFTPDMAAWAGSKPASKSEKVQGDPDRGRAVFNGKGVCYYCHGVDGYRGRPPKLKDDTLALIARLNPPPTDLRNPKTLRLKTDEQRTRAVREGHPGTGMFPDTTMTDQDLTDTLAYLALIRSEGLQESGATSGPHITEQQP
jgi:mono/diheme cytochrome c family protein